MKQFLLLMLAALLPCFSLQAAPKFDANTKYRFVCKMSESGSLVLGSKHNSSAYLYYATDIEDADDAWWTIKAEGNGYTISNASTGTYITYSSQRIDGVAKGLVLSEASMGTASQWTFSEMDDNAFVVANVGDTKQWWNLRTDKSYLLGTYDKNQGSLNEQFYIYDEKGNQVTSDGTIPGGGSTPEGGDVREDFNAAKGITPEGEYWELTGIKQPVVYTTDKTKPVLYSIANHRSSKYVMINDGHLYQTDNADSRTQFYFVESAEKGNVQIFTKDGQYVSTTYNHSANDHVAVADGTPTGNLWKLEWSSLSTNGYGICRTDNIETDNWNGGEWGDGNWGWEDESSYTYWNDYNRQYVGLYTLDAGSTFVFASSDKRHIDLLNQQGITFTTIPEEGTTRLFAAVDSLQLGGKELVYDKSSLTYFHPLPQTLIDGGDYTATLHFVPKEKFEALTLQIDGQPIEGRTDEVTLRDVTCDHTYSLQLIDEQGQTQAEGKLQFTFLPLVEVNVPSCNGSTYTTGSLRVTNIDVLGYDSLHIAAFRYRGATAQGYPKKAYAIKLRDAAGASVDRSYFGLRSDNNWILDAMAVDPACMRNRVATDIWNDFSTAPYYKDREKKVRTGTRGRFVEVFLNGRYYGIYCMTEKMDRKQLKLKKFKSAAESTSGSDEVHGLLYKSSQWSYEVFMGHYTDNENFPGTAPRDFSNQLGRETWAEFEQKYPDFEKEAVEWTPLWNGVNFVATSSQSQFDAHVADYFDLPVAKDYYLFIDLLLATDNHGKNMLYYVYDREGNEADRLSLAPWDLDGTLGARWDGTTYYTKDATQDFDNFLWKYEHGEHTLFYKLRHSSSLKWDKQLADRYAEIRPKHFRADILAKRFTDYGRLFSASHADDREMSRWKNTSVNHSDIPSAVEFCEEWIATRVKTLDEKYGYDATLDAVNSAKADAYFAVDGGDRSLIIHSGCERTVNIHNLSGMLIRTVKAQAGQTEVNALIPGVYVVNGIKVIVR